MSEASHCDLLYTYQSQFMIVYAYIIDVSHYYNIIINMHALQVDKY